MKGRLFRKIVTITGAALASFGVVTVAWALASQLDTAISIGLLTVIIGLQIILIGYVSRLVASDWPPSIIYAAGVDQGYRKARDEAARERREDLEVVVPMRRAR